MSWFSSNKHIEKVGGSYFYPMGARSTLFNEKTFDAFNEVPEVNSVLNYRANAKKNVRMVVVNKVNNKPSISQNAAKALKLINNPNFFQERNEFIGQSSLFHDISGNEYLYFMNSVGFKPINSKAIFTLPPQIIDVELKTKLPFWEIGNGLVDINYTAKIFNKEISLEPGNIVHYNDNRVNFDSQQKNVLKGESKLTSLRGPINNIIAAYGARNTFLVNRGALGILSNNTTDVAGSVPLDDKERERLQEDLKRYGIQGNQWHTIITNLSLNWQQMSVDIDKLKVFDEVKEDFFKILDAYSVPQDLFSFSKKGVTFQNQSSSEKRFYEGSIIPEMNEWIAGINRYFGTENETWELRGDFTHLPIFQENVKERSLALQTIVNALSQALQDGAISLDQYKNELTKFGV